MINRHLFAAVSVLTVSALACSRQAESRSPSEATPLAPAAGATTSKSRATNLRGCGEHFKAFDEDGDGRVSKSEFDAQPHARPDPSAVFSARDRDGDASLTEVEFCSGFRGAAASDAARGGGQGMAAGALGPTSGAPGRQHQAPGSMLGARCGGHFDAFDADHDGKLNQGEFAGWPHAHGEADTLFAARDVDHDGTITREEFCSAWSP